MPIDIATEVGSLSQAIRNSGQRDLTMTGLMFLSKLAESSSNSSSGGGSTGYKSTATITRAANTTPYIAGDVYGGLFELPNFAAAGGHVFLNSVRIIFNISSLPVGMAGFDLYLYNAVPTSLSDNAAWSLPAGDRDKVLTPKGIYLDIATLATGGGSVVLSADNLGLQLQTAPGQTSVWGYLPTKSGFTPAANSETATITTMGAW